MSRFRRTIGLGSAVALLFLGTALVGTASAANPGCGEEITTDTTLTADVGPCNDGDGLVVAASDITLNLNGHKVFADKPLPRMTCGVPNPMPPPATICVSEDVVGIYLNDVTNVAVRNGTVHGFSAGVVIDFGGSNTVANMTVRDNQGPCIGEDFTTQAVGTFGDGIAMFSSTDNRIELNQVLRNSPFSGIAVVSNTELINNPVPPLPTGNKIIGNNIDNNALCFANIGVRIEGPGATNNLVQGNRINKSFQEGIAVQAVNNTNFSGVFSNPPTCSNRGFPPGLPQCPQKTGANVTPGNSYNSILNNQVTNSGLGGAQNPPTGGSSAQAASGIKLLNFCGADVRNGRGNVISGNAALYNASAGVDVGGCQPPGTPGSGGTVGWVSNKIYNNLSQRNNAARCGTLPSNPGCGGRPTVARPDVLDTNNVITCPSTSTSVQGICASLGFPAPPASPTQFVGTRVVLPGGPVPGPCDSNQWKSNVFGTAFPPCAAGNVTRISSAPEAASAAAAAAEGSPGTGASSGESGRPLRAPSSRR